MRRIERISKKWQKISLSEKTHNPVMCKEIIEYLEPENKHLLADCTLGLGGHAEDLLSSMPEDAKLIGIDKDEESLSLARDRLKRFKGRFYPFHDDFKHIDNILSSLGADSLDGALFDLGTSMYQLSSFGRGFSFLREGPLDMRMDRTVSISAYDLVNNLSEKELDYIFREYGQEHWHKKIARCIVEERKQYPIATTLHLADLVVRVLGNRRSNFGIHPATRIFQALRIAVNRELDSLRIALSKVMGLLSYGGRVCVISFHSLEDRIVKDTFKEFQNKGGYRIVTRKPVKASFGERKINPKSRSAKLRVIERI